MRIENIKLRNFKTFESFELNPKKITAIIGPNGSGKSSIMEGIRYLLTGETPTEPVKSGADLATVSSTLLGVNIERFTGKKSGVRLNGKTTTQKSLDLLIRDRTGVTKDSIGIATSAKMLSSMSAGAFSQFLVNNGLIPIELDLDMLYSLCLVSSQAKGELSTVLPKAPVKFTMEDIEEAYKHFFSERTKHKGLIIAKENEANFVGNVPKRTIEDIEKDLDMFKVYSAKKEAYKKEMMAYEKAVALRERSLNEIKRIKEKIISYGIITPSDPEQITALESRLKKLFDDVESEQKTAKTFQMNIEMLSRTLDNLQKPVCPISAKLICTTDKTTVKEEITEAKKANEAELHKSNCKIALLKEEIDKVRRTLAELRTNDSKFNELKILNERKNALIDSMAEIPAMPEAIEEIDETKKSALLEERQNAIRYQIALKAKPEYEDMKSKLNVLEELVTLLSPKNGLRQEILLNALEPIIEHCNERSKMLKMNFEISLMVENGVKILCKTDTTKISEWLPIENASSGEQAYVMFLIMDALNALHGLGILILDDLDKLDKEALASLLKLLENPEVSKTYDHIFMAMVDHQDAIEVLKASTIDVITL